MDNVSLVIDQDVLIVSIFDLEDIADEGVSCKTLAEGILGLFEVLRSWVASAKLIYEELVERGPMLFMNLI